MSKAAMKFRSKYDFKNENTYGQDLSREIEPVYEIGEDGNPVKVSETNVYQAIQVCRDECDIYNILKRYEAGDYSVIGDPQSMTYGDVSDMPKDMIDSMSNMDIALANWTKLPQGLRDLFNNNITEFMKAKPEDINTKVNEYTASLEPKKGDNE